jgi:hypothetical protein
MSDRFDTEGLRNAAAVIQKLEKPPIDALVERANQGTGS